MDQGLSTLISSIVSSAIAAAVGALSAVLSYRMAQRQVKMSREQVAQMVLENDKNRRSQYFQMVLPRRLEAAEILWHLLFQIEHGSFLSAEDKCRFIAAQIWLPGELSGEFIGLLFDWERAQDEELETYVLMCRIKKCREGLIRLIGLEEFNEWR